MKTRTKIILAGIVVLVLAAGSFAVYWHLAPKPLQVSACAWAGTQHFPTEASTKTLADGTVVPADFDKQGRMTFPAGNGPYSVTAVFDKDDMMRSCPGLVLEENRTITVEFTENSKPTLREADLTLNLIFNEGTGSWLWRDEIQMERSDGLGMKAYKGEGENGTHTFYVNMGSDSVLTAE